MVKFNREQLKKELPFLIKLIQQNHVMEDNIERELFHNRKFKPQKGLCHQRGYFQIIDGGVYYLQYVMDHIITDPDLMLIGRTVQEVIFYESYQEYESERVKAMSKTADQTGLNHN